MKQLAGVVVDVDYKLAPEHLFPTAVFDPYDALKWVTSRFHISLALDNALTHQVAASLNALGVDPRKAFIVGGISAGANLTATISHLYRDDDLFPPITGLYLSIPSLVSEYVVPEKHRDQYLPIEQNKNAPLFGSKVAIDFFRGMYSTRFQIPTHTHDVLN